MSLFPPLCAWHHDILSNKCCLYMIYRIQIPNKNTRIRRPALRISMFLFPPLCAWHHDILRNTRCSSMIYRQNQYLSICLPTFSRYYFKINIFSRIIYMVYQHIKEYYRYTYTKATQKTYRYNNILSKGRTVHKQRKRKSYIYIYIHIKRES